MSDQRHFLRAPDGWDWKSWLIRALRNFVLRFIFIGGALQATNYVFALDDDYRAYITHDRGVLAIGLVLCLIVNLMYEWLWRRGK